MSADANSDLNHPVLNLTPQEKTAFAFLFSQADSDQLGVVTGERAVAFFERTKVNPNVLGEIWQIADTENRGLLTRPGFCMVLRLIGHYQAGKEPSAELAFKPGPVPKFEGLSIPGVSTNTPAAAAAVPSPTGGQFPTSGLQPQLSGQGPIRVPPLDPAKVQQYSRLFKSSGAQNGALDGATAKTIFEKAGLPNEVLGKIWNLSDRQQRGALDQTEFIIAMHLLASMKMRLMTALPNNLPQGLYEAAARRGAPPPPGGRGAVPPGGIAGAIPRNFTGGSMGTPARTQSPLARPPSYSTPPPPQSATTTGTPWLVTPQEKARYDQFFATIDTQHLGVITGEQAVQFFSDSRLPEDTLATIWDLADIRSEGQLNRDEFAVAMYLIGQQRTRNSPPLPAFLPPALMPPSMRQQPQQTKSTAPAFDNASQPAHMPKSAADDLFGLDEPSPPQQALQAQTTGFQAPTAGLQPQTTGASATRDPFGGSVPASPSSPTRFPPQPQQQQGSSVFKPFMPTSAFGASLAQQHTGGSTSSSQRGFQPQQQPAHPSQLQQTTVAEDDLLGDNDAHAEESRNISSDTTELANMSSQIGNLRGQMETTQGRKNGLQGDLTATQTQKRDLELRLQQFRAQYETEVRTVKELETQLTSSRESTKKLGQELAMLEGGYQDLQTQHQQVAQQLQADQQENATLKQRIGQINAEVTRLKPEIEKMKLDARQQKGLVSINKKQVATGEGERDRLQGEKEGLEREAREREEAARNAPQQEQSHFGRDAAFGAAGAGAVGAAAFGGYEAGKDRQPSGTQTAGEARSPPATGSSGFGSMNPFFRKASGSTAEALGSPPATERATSPFAASGPPTAAAAGPPTPSAFDSLFGPSAAFAPNGQASSSRTGTPPATSFVGRNIPSSAAQKTGGSGGQGLGAGMGGMTDSVQSVSSTGEPTPSATPPLSGSDQAKDSPIAGQESVPPPVRDEGRQSTPSQLPVVALPERGDGDASPSSSTGVLPPTSRAGGTGTPRDLEPESAVSTEGLPGVFPGEDEGEMTREVKPEEPAPAPATSVRDDFDSAFAGFGAGEAAKGDAGHDDDPFAPAGTSQQQPQPGHSSEFPPIQSLEPEEEEESSDDDDEEETGHRGFGDSFTSGATSPPPPGHGVAEPIAPESAPTSAPSATEHLHPEANIAGVRPVVQSVNSTASTLPSADAVPSPPSYEQSAEPAFGGSGERTESNQFPPEFDGLLPARQDPTSPPPPAAESPEEGISGEQKENERPQGYQQPERTATGSSSLYPNTVPHTPSTTDVFHDASSRPISSFTDAMASPQAQPAGQQAPRSAFDDFDEFNDLSEAKEADKSNSDFDFAFGGASSQQHGAGNEFDSAFDSPAPSVSNTMTSEQRTPVPGSKQVDGFSNFQQSAHDSSSPFDGFGGPAASGSANAGGQPEASSIQNTPQNVQHDWDAIFSGLDSSNDVDTSFAGTESSGQDPWGTPPAATNGQTSTAAADKPPTFQPPPGPPPAAAATKAQQMGRAITPGTEHDDPILKRLTGMGYPRTEALGALEMYDYDINKAVDHLTSGK